MGLLSFLTRIRRKPVMREIPVQADPVVTAQELRQLLFDAAAAGDDQTLECLCQRHERSIFEKGLMWSNVPAEIRANPTLLRWYGTGLKAIANFCAQRLNKPELLQKAQELESVIEEGKEQGHD